MKQYTLLLYIATVALLLSACKDGNAFGDEYQPRLSLASDDVVEAYYFRPSTTSLTFSAQSATQTVTIESSTSFSVQVSDSWLTVSPASGSGNTTLQVTCTENTSTVERTATISFLVGNDISFNTQTGNQTRSTVAAILTVTQASDYILSHVFSSGLGAFKSISVSGDNEWKIDYGCTYVTGYRDFDGDGKKENTAGVT